MAGLSRRAAGYRATNTLLGHSTALRMCLCAVGMALCLRSFLRLSFIMYISGYHFTDSARMDGLVGRAIPTPEKYTRTIRRMMHRHCQGLHGKMSETGRRVPVLVPKTT